MVHAMGGRERLRVLRMGARSSREEEVLSSHLGMRKRGDVRLIEESA